MIEKLHISINIPKNLTIDDFNIIETTGSNNWGNTCKVIHVKTDRIYSSIIINRNECWPIHEHIIQQLQNYIDVSKHENVNGINALFEYDQFVFVIYEYNEINLALLYGNRMYWNEIDFEQKMEVFMNIVSAVRACHKAGFIHGDVRMKNIEIRSDSSACLVHFNKSCLNHSPECVEAVLLDPPPPETVLTPPIISTALDCWGLGLLLYELFVDVTNFNMVQLNNSKFEFLFDLLPDDIRVLGQGLLQSDPTQRWNTKMVLKYLSKIGF